MLAAFAWASSKPLVSRLRRPSFMQRRMVSDCVICNSLAALWILSRSSFGIAIGTGFEDWLVAECNTDINFFYFFLAMI